MEIEVLESSSNEIEVKLGSITVAELLRVYLNKEGIEFAAWRREHPTKPLIFKIKSSKGTVKKAISDTISSIKKDLGVLKKAK